MLSRRSFAGASLAGIAHSRSAVAWRFGAAVRTLVAAGDSITAFTALGSYPDLYQPLANPPLGRYTNAGVSGYTVEDLISTFSSLPNFGSPKILSVLIGANGLINPAGGVTAWLATLASYTNNARAAGFRVVVCTVLPQTQVGFNANQATANAQIKGAWGAANADYICDFTSNPNLTDASNSTYFNPDGTHPTNAGFSTMETTYAPVINSI